MRATAWRCRKVATVVVGLRRPRALELLLVIPSLNILVLEWLLFIHDLLLLLQRLISTRKLKLHPCFGSHSSLRM